MKGELGKRLKELRKKSNKTQEEVSAALEMRRAKYSKLEAGLQDFKTDDIVKICNYFKISSDYLLGISKTPSLDTDLQAVCKYTGLSENAVKQITTDGFIFVFNEKGLELHYNEENGKWEVRKEPFAVIECESEEAYNKFKQLIERDTKKKPVAIQVENYAAYPSHCCPGCDMFVSSLDNYCKECGQALDWSEEEYGNQ